MAVGRTREASPRQLMTSPSWSAHFLCYQKILARLLAALVVLVSMLLEVVLVLPSPSWCFPSCLRSFCWVLLVQYSESQGFSSVQLLQRMEEEVKGEILPCAYAPYPLPQASGPTYLELVQFPGFQKVLKKFSAELVVDAWLFHGGATTAS